MLCHKNHSLNNPADAKTPLDGCHAALYHVRSILLSDLIFDINIAAVFSCLISDPIKTAIRFLYLHYTFPLLQIQLSPD